MNTLEQLLNNRISGNKKQIQLQEDLLQKIAEVRAECDSTEAGVRSRIEEAKARIAEAEEQLATLKQQ